LVTAAFTKQAGCPTDYRGMVKTNQEFAFVLAKRASSREGDPSIFRRMDTLEIVPEWVEAIVAEHPLILAGVGEQPEYCVTDASVWRRRSRSEAERLFSLDSVARAHWMRRQLWRELKEALPSHGEQWATDVKKREWSNVDVELNSGDGVLLEAAGSWLLRFLDRCSHYNAEKSSRT
jgi:hypothetical protein